MVFPLPRGLHAIVGDPLRVDVLTGSGLRDDRGGGVVLRRRVHPQGCRQVLLLLLLLLKELGVVGGKLVLDQILGELKIEITHERERPQKNHPRLNAEELSFAAPVLVIYFRTKLWCFWPLG